MSELITTKIDRQNLRWKLLVTVSTATLLSTVCVTGPALAARDSDDPTVWIELGGQLERTDGQSSPIPLPFVTANPNSPTFDPLSPLDVQRPVRYSYGGEGKLIFAPKQSDWIFTASARYGRSSNNKHVHQQTAGAIPTSSFVYGYVSQAFNKAFSDTKTTYEESHLILDFQAGKDIGLGMFGRNGISTLSLGVRFAQFSSKSTLGIHARPFFKTYPSLPLKYWRNYAVEGQHSHSFDGIGPSLSWDGSVPLVGEPDAAEISFDWGVNAALLFGRQKAEAQHTATASAFTGVPGGAYISLYYHPPKHSARSRTAVVPNLGGFAGISFRYGDGKVKFGYRGDFFFGAMDTGIDSRKTATTSFHGPFATISIGLGN